jgi:hypothetical protein
MRRGFAIALLCGILAAVPAFCAVSTEATARHVAKDSGPDTNPDSAFWRGAPSVSMTNDEFGNPVPGYKSEILSQWTDGNLYFLFICPYEELSLKPDPAMQTETYALWKWDVAETYIGSDFQNIRRYKEFEVSPQGEWVDLDINLDIPHNDDSWHWNSGFQVAGRVDASTKTWYGFMRIPYQAIDTRPAAVGNVLRINFYRMQGPPPESARKHILWQPTMRHTFHAPEAFGTLKLVEH